MTTRKICLPLLATGLTYCFLTGISAPALTARDTGTFPAAAPFPKTAALADTLQPSAAPAAAERTARKERKKSSFADFFAPKSKLRKQVDSLLRLTDSLQNELAIARSELYLMEAADSLMNAESINTGGFDLTDDEELLLGEPADTDSLLAAWYEQKNLSLQDTARMELDTTVLTSNIPDSVYIERLYRMNSFISIPYNNIVRNMLIYYTQRIPNTAEVILGLAPHYMPVFEEIFDSYGMPVELAAMAIIESALNPKAVSRARAKGMWQFMYTTALRYNLTINSFVDERFDAVKSADAAARYLKDSYEIFGDWMLAIASYNCGAGNVSKAIRRSGGSKDVWEIYPYLPRETRGYIPSFIAALYLLEYYPEHQITPRCLPMPSHIDTLQINRMLHFDQVAHYTGITKEELRSLNPQYLHDIIPGAEREYILRLPYRYTGAFVDHEEEIYAYKDSVYFNPSALKLIRETGSSSSKRIVHTVRRGETLSHIALKYGVRVSDLQRWNGVKSNIRVGQRIVVYRGGGPSSTASVSKSSARKSERPSGERTVHTVKSGETLSHIALKYGVRVSDLQQWNGIRTNIRVGQKIVVYAPGSGSAPATSVSDGYVIYTVKSGDNLWDIAKKFSGVTANDIMKLNGMNGSSRIYPGMKLKIQKR